MIQLEPTCHKSKSLILTKDQVFDDSQHNSWSCNDFWWKMKGSMIEVNIGFVIQLLKSEMFIHVIVQLCQVEPAKSPALRYLLYRVSNQIMKRTSWLQATNIIQFQKTSKDVSTTTSLTMHLITTPSLATLKHNNTNTCTDSKPNMLINL